ncbi:hypothetical protein Lal_00032896 [Lupinus albus]|nr:hypothetical protein Lal_00032896 [Lupinus albus]
MKSGPSVQPQGTLNRMKGIMLVGSLLLLKLCLPRMIEYFEENLFKYLPKWVQAQPRRFHEDLLPDPSTNTILKNICVISSLPTMVTTINQANPLSQVEVAPIDMSHNHNTHSHNPQSHIQPSNKASRTHYTTTRPPHPTNQHLLQIIERGST